jgi:hypothetical protein
MLHAVKRIITAQFIELYGVCMCVRDWLICYNRSNGQSKYSIGQWSNFYKVHKLKYKLNLHPKMRIVFEFAL